MHSNAHKAQGHHWFVMFCLLSVFKHRFYILRMLTMFSLVLLFAIWEPYCFDSRCEICPERQTNEMHELFDRHHFERFSQLGKGFRNSKRKKGVTTNLLEIVRVQFGKTRSILFCSLTFFCKYCCLTISERVVTPKFFFFLDSNGPNWDAFPASAKVTSDEKILLY